MLERRRNPRRDVNIPGLMALGDRRGVGACRLKDLSAIGALIAVNEPGQLPDTLTLFFDDPDNPLKIVVAEARIVRVLERHAALEFLSNIPVAPWRVVSS